MASSSQGVLDSVGQSCLLSTTLREVENSFLTFTSNRTSHMMNDHEAGHGNTFVRYLCFVIMPPWISVSDPSRLPQKMLSALLVKNVATLLRVLRATVSVIVGESFNEHSCCGLLLQLAV